MKIFLPIIMLIADLIVAGCTTPNNSNNNTATTVASNFVAEADDHVYVHYTGTFDNGEVFDSSVGKEPLDFIVGAGQMIKGFDNAVVGMKEGESKVVTIPPEDGYGPSDPEKIIEVEKNRTPEGVKVGDILYSGSQQIVVIEVKNETVLIDTNSPVAGKNLTFEITMMKIEKKVS